jgi:hypothetical protein
MSDSKETRDALANTADEARALFRHHEGRPELKPLGRPCHDCAVECGFYMPFAEALSLLPKDEVEFHSARWFCHLNPDRACAGNIEFQNAALLKAREAK